MLSKSTLIAAVAVAAISIASPALAQTFSSGWGTGNSLSTYYDRDGGLHLGAVRQENNARIAARSNGSNAVAQSRMPLRATAQEQNEFRHGDYYAPGKTVVQRATGREQSAFRQGDFYAPAVD